MIADLTAMTDADLFDLAEYRNDNAGVQTVLDEIRRRHVQLEAQLNEARRNLETVAARNWELEQLLRDSHRELANLVAIRQEFKLP